MNELGLVGGVVLAPAFLPDAEVAKCSTYREIVRVSWANRRSKAMTRQTLAEMIGCYASHVSDYLQADDKPSRRDLPAKCLNAWAATVGNWGVQQWLNRQSKLTIMEEVIAQRAA
ncbi:helix-turn-helix transcriptional regulator [Paraburkholderia sp. C35]|uniref:helix-turn-helix domain-containing protein n=1 Tax=Paraburkholderia sp. C35 TaxID=2126993 RepID=UPI0013A5A3A8|nr:helix-turn-helix transcriptional regulator [Paraburkholderia sp. C35]